MGGCGQKKSLVTGIRGLSALSVSVLMRGSYSQLAAISCRVQHRHPYTCLISDFHLFVQTDGDASGRYPVPELDRYLCLTSEHTRRDESFHARCARNRWLRQRVNQSLFSSKFLAGLYLCPSRPMYVRSAVPRAVPDEEDGVALRSPGTGRRGN